MNSVRSAKIYYFAAFIFGALIALVIVSPARSAETFRIDPSSLGQTAVEAVSRENHTSMVHHVGLFSGAAAPSPQFSGKKDRNAAGAASP